MRIGTRLARPSVSAAVAAAVMLACTMVAGEPVARAAGRPGAPTGAAAPVQPRVQATADSGPSVHAPWAELADMSTAQDLWSRHSVTEHPMGSITKVMTAYVVLKAGHLNQVITVPEAIIAYDHKFDASTAGLVPGEKLTALQLLYAMMLPSGCDAAFTLAVAYGPGRGAFIAKMNAAAKALRLTKTHFTDSAGLPDPGQYTTYSTARDLIGLGRDAMRIALFRQIVATRSYHVAAGSGHNAHTWKNGNQLLAKYPGAIGIKPGFTNAAGQCLLFAAIRNGKTLIGVVLDSSPSITNFTATVKDATAMLNWGFSHPAGARAASRT
jgi:D-alanyl-D-alanine carboxypeptidase (penicillin-binding protein 5/6)